MPAERRDKEINRNTYSILLPPPSQCMPLCNETLALLGPILLSSGRVDGMTFGGLAAAMQQTDPGRIDAIMMQAVKIAKLSFNEKPVFVGIEFDMHFDSRRKDLYPACLWALWECVRDFLPDWVTSVLSQVDLNEMKKKVFESRTDGP